MPRCRVVSPDVVRLFLVDVHRRALVAVGERFDAKKATADDVSAVQARVTQAEADGDWIDIRKRLNAGERRAMFARMYLAGLDGSMRVNPFQQGIARTTAYLVDWSLVGPDGKTITIEGLPVEAVSRALDRQDPETVEEIAAAISFHEEAMEAEKNATARTGVLEPSATSLSAA